MDSLPVEIIAKILGYLPAEDVCQLQFLNSRFKQTTEIYRKHLEFPRVTVEIEEYDESLRSPTGNLTCVSFLRGRRTFEAFFKSADFLNSAKLTICDGGRDEKNFFASWQRQGMKNDLQAFFCWLFQKGDVALNVKSELTTGVEMALKEAIEQTNTRFVEMTFSMEDTVTIPQFCFAAVQRARNEFPKMPLNLILDGEISSFFLAHLAFLNFYATVTVSDLCNAAKAVAEYWENNPDAKFNFQFSVKYNANTCYSCPIRLLPEKFQFSMMTQECMKPTARTKPSVNVSLEDRPQILQILFFKCNSKIFVNFHVVNSAE